MGEIVQFIGGGPHKNRVIENKTGNPMPEVIWHDDPDFGWSTIHAVDRPFVGGRYRHEWSRTYPDRLRDRWNEINVVYLWRPMSPAERISLAFLGSKKFERRLKSRGR